MFSKINKPRTDQVGAARKAQYIHTTFDVLRFLREVENKKKGFTVLQLYIFLSHSLKTYWGGRTLVLSVFKIFLYCCGGLLPWPLFFFAHKIDFSLPWNTQ